MYRVLVSTSIFLFFTSCVYAQSFVTTGKVDMVSTRVEQLLKLPTGYLSQKYNVQFTVDAGPNAPVIVHIGQVHEDYRGAEYSQQARGQILHNQTRIQQLISEIVKKNQVNCVFAEGFAQKSPDALLAVRSRREAVINAINLRAKQTRSFYVKDVEIFEPFISRIKTFRQYNDAEIQVKVYEAIVGYLEQRTLPENDAKKVAAARSQLEGLYRKYGKFPSVLMSGAVNKLFFEHKIAAVCPAEDFDVNMRAQEAMKRANALTSTTNAQETERILREQRATVIHERDAAVQALIRTIPQKYKSKVVIAVFGDAHDWTRVTKEVNAAQKNGIYSYIKITPKSGSTW
jgi:hypothetical protein